MVTWQFRPRNKKFLVTKNKLRDKKLVSSTVKTFDDPIEAQEWIQKSFHSTVVTVQRLGGEITYREENSKNGIWFLEYTSNRQRYQLIQVDHDDYLKIKKVAHRRGKTIKEIFHDFVERL